MSRSTTSLLTPGVIAPQRAVPATIAVPDYVGKPAPAPFRGPAITPPEVVERMRVAGKIAAQALQEVGSHIRPGVSTDELDRVGHEFLIAHDAYPSTLGYRGFPKSLCASINEVVCHGIPDSTELVEGDICNIDITAYMVIDGVGVHGDTNATFFVGEVDQQSRDLVDRTQEALKRAIKAVAPGRQVNTIGRVIESYARRFGYGVVRDYTGHGISTSFHSGLIIPHYDCAPLHSEELRPGMTFTIEPMLNLGVADTTVWEDDWTVVTTDGKRSAQFEHTLVVTEDGAEILTLP